MTDHRHRHRAMLVVYYPSSACRRPWFEGIRSLDCHGLRMLQGAAEAVLWMIGGWIGTGLPPRAVTWTVSRTHGTVAVPELQVGRTGGTGTQLGAPSTDGQQHKWSTSTARQPVRPRDRSARHCAATGGTR
ncbi:hypothetical protein BDA96_02G212700 [Sorghum bicolor]|uniref:Uncharacterized protein n=2 Tax=Sorghum bicolor TaxID=4558 RepID=A0A921UW62_SORBI|nr:hypothetical protein BDA96_02G212700 [Sorghum bicolor]OQU89492.1 hypothetical protein SORBI_3002G202050 [Sorghum bicolor]